MEERTRYFSPIQLGFHLGAKELTGSELDMQQLKGCAARLRMQQHVNEHASVEDLREVKAGNPEKRAGVRLKGAHITRGHDLGDLKEGKRLRLE